MNERQPTEKERTEYLGALKALLRLVQMVDEKDIPAIMEAVSAVNDLWKSIGGSVPPEDEEQPL